MAIEDDHEAIPSFLQSNTIALSNVGNTWSAAHRARLAAGALDTWKKIQVLIQIQIQNRNTNTSKNYPKQNTMHIGIAIAFSHRTWQ